MKLALYITEKRNYGETGITLFLQVIEIEEKGSAL